MSVRPAASPSVPAAAIHAEGLSKRYGETQALAGLDLSVPRGAVLALLGHNGAGKTTLVRILATLLHPDSGSAFVAGHDVLREPGRVREEIALASQDATLDERLTGHENLVLLGRLQGLAMRAAKARAGALLERFDLADAGSRLVGTYSGGMRRRLDLAACLVVPRSVLFLDEPTTGLDPIGRSDMWDSIRDLTEGGATVLLTTQYLEEADRLADHVTVLSRGRTVAEGTPEQLKDRVGARRVEITLSGRDALAPALAALVDGGFEPIADERGRVLSAPAPRGAEDLGAALGALRAASIEVEEAALSRPTLDDAFVALTGAHDTGEHEAVESMR